MPSLHRTTVYDADFASIRDAKALGRINAKLRRLELGNTGNVAPVGEGVSELKIDYGPGYRVYFCQQGAELVLLLCCGNKSTQSSDIKRAKDLKSRLKMKGEAKSESLELSGGDRKEI